MKKEECYELGYVVKTHGLDGELNLHFDVDNPDDYANLEVVFVEESNQLAPYFIEHLHPYKDSNFITKFEEINSIEAAQKLVNGTLYLPLTMLPKLEDGQFYFHEVIEYTVHDKTLGTLGKVENIFSGVQSLIVMSYKNKEVLIPITDEIVNKVDHEQKILYVTLPEGLLDVYLEDL